jgi:hypothetical protein
MTTKASISGDGFSEVWTHKIKEGKTRWDRTKKLGEERWEMVSVAQREGWEVLFVFKHPLSRCHPLIGVVDANLLTVEQTVSYQ